MNQPRRRVSGCDTRNKVTSVNITERCSSSEVGKSVLRSHYTPEHQGKPRRVSSRDTRNKVTNVKKIERCSSSEVGKSVQRSHYTKEHQGKLEGGKEKNHQPLSSSEESSSEDSVSDFEKESEQVLKIQPERVYKTRSKGPISENLVRKICPAQEKMAGHMDGERKETGCTLRQAISESLQHFYEDLFSEIDRDIRYRKLRPHLYGLVQILTFELKNNMLYKMEGAQPVEWGEAPLEEWEEWK